MSFNTRIQIILIALGCLVLVLAAVRILELVDIITKAREKSYAKQERRRFTDQEFPRVFPFFERTASQNLLEYGIQSKSDWKKWLIKNHTDRGGNLQICQKVNELARSMGWCN